MKLSFRNLFALGSVSIAILLLAWAWFLIQKNTPKAILADVRFSPPTSPLSEKLATASMPGNGRYIGGVGIIEPVGEAVMIGSHLPGIVAKVLVRAGDQVKKGDPLFAIDDRAAQANSQLAKSNLLEQESKLNELRAQVPSQKARVDAARALEQQAEATLANAKQELTRSEALAKQNAVSEEELGTRRLAYSVASAKLAEAQARHREAFASLELIAGEKSAPSIEVQQVAVEQAKASLEKERITLELHRVLAPRDGEILQVKIREGEFAPAAVLSTPLMILGDIETLHVRVDIDESEIPRFAKEASAFASVRGRPTVKVPLSFVRTEPYVIPKKTLNGGVSERVDTRVLQIIYSVSPDAIQAIPGQQVDVYIEELASSLTH
jgi:multidrug efflux pump subunit AcrA (membrane-fusion protein)